MRSTPAPARCGRFLGRGLLVAALTAGGVAHANAQPLDAATAGRFVRLALDCVHREYPNKIAHVLTSDRDVGVPRELTPAFYGCYDWHSAVHGHWLLVRLVRLAGDGGFEPAARAALARSLTVRNIEGELRYLNGHGRIAFERPYGLAWLLQLAAELREWHDADAARWRAALEPLEREAARRLADWLPKLTHPVRVGEHSQTAFALALALDWARAADDRGLRRLVRARTEDYYGQDRDCPLAYEPSGQDFLSPCLAEADLLRRVREPHDFAAWLDRFLPGIPRSGDAGGHRVAGAGGRQRSPRRQARAPRRPEPQPGLDAGRNRRGSAGRRRAPARAAGDRAAPPGGRSGRGHRRALRRRPLARQLRHLPGHGARTELNVDPAATERAAGQRTGTTGARPRRSTRRRRRPPARRAAIDTHGPSARSYGRANASTLLVDTSAMYCFPLT